MTFGVDVEEFGLFVLMISIPHTTGNNLHGVTSNNGSYLSILINSKRNVRIIVIPLWSSRSSLVNELTSYDLLLMWSMIWTVSIWSPVAPCKHANSGIVSRPLSVRSGSKSGVLITELPLSSIVVFCNCFCNEEWISVRSLMRNISQKKK